MTIEAMDDRGMLPGTTFPPMAKGAGRLESAVVRGTLAASGTPVFLRCVHYFSDERPCWATCRPDGSDEFKCVGPIWWWPTESRNAVTA